MPSKKIFRRHFFSLIYNSDSAVLTTSHCVYTLIPPYYQKLLYHIIGNISLRFNRKIRKLYCDICNSYNFPQKNCSDMAFSHLKKGKTQKN